VKRLNLIFMGTPDIAVPALRAIADAGHTVAAVVTQPDRPAGRGRKLTRCPVAEEALELGLKVWQPEQVATAFNDLQKLGADAACVMAFGQLLPADLIEVFPMGCINVHTSLLPELRGAAPINWAIVQGKKRTGVSTMLMDEGLDTGDVLLQQATGIDPQETAGSLAERLAQMGAELLVRTLDELAQGKLNPRPQDEASATYARRLAKSDGLVDWQRPAAEVDLLVRGLDPWPTAHTVWEGKTFRLFAPTAVIDIAPPAQPGAVIAPPPGREDLLWLACGRGALGVGQVQAAGRRRMVAGDFLRGAQLKPGARLGG
jgi:methionyl-tRNA formyltransferase